MERLVQAHALQPVHELLRVVAIVFVDEVGHADVGRHFQDACHVYLAVASAVPVVVPHLASIHVHHPVTGVYQGVWRYFSVFQGHHDRGRLESRTGFQQVADGVAVHLVVLSVAGFGQVDDGFHFAGGNFHQHGDAHESVDALQFVTQCFLANVLHADVDGRNHVTAVLRRNVDYVEVAVHDLLAVGDAVAAAKHGVEG